MKRIYVIALMLSFCSLILAQKYSIYDLKVNGKNSPVGIDTQNLVFSWKISSIERNFIQPSYQIEVWDEQNNLVWNSKRVKSDNSIGVKYEGKSLKSGGYYTWIVRVGKVKSQIASFVIAPNFDGAKWIGLEKDKDDYRVVPGIHSPLVQHEIGDRKTGMYTLPLLRRDFDVEKPVKRAIISLSGLGHFELFANGSKVGDHFLDPGWTDYSRNALYESFDVTDMLQKGKNTLGIMLGGGFYNVPRERYYKQLISFGAPKAVGVLEITYQNGLKERIVTNTEWQASHSPITYSSIYGGEDYDKGLLQKGWNTPNFDASHWKSAVESQLNIELLAQKSEPLKVRNRFNVVKKYKNHKGNTIYDFGQNMSGIIELKVKGKDGTIVRMHPAELLNKDSTTNQSASGAPYYFEYKISGDTVQEWRPQFSYYGFRYIELDRTENLESIEINALHTTNSAREVGRFSCSSPMFNKVYELIDWSIRSNLASILTDCPHREKLGWLEVAHLMQYSMQYRYDLSTFYQKTIDDMANAQYPDGMVPTIAPEYVHFSDGFENTPEWGSAFIICSWYYYKWYTDKTLLEKYYDKMSGYVDYLTSRSKEYIVAYGLGDWYDLGPGTPGYSQLTTVGVTSTAIYYYDVTIMRRIAQLLGKKADSEKFAALGTKIKNAFNKKYFNEQTKTYDRNSQTANAMALYMGLVEDQNRKIVLSNLITDIAGRDYALTAGDIGYRYVLRALDDNDRNEVVYRMNSRYNVPGYGWQLAGGATALTESWQNYGFVSNNHCMLGHLMEWFFSVLGGIKQSEDSVAFKELIIAPVLVSGINSAQTSLETSYGRVECRWKDETDGFSMDVTIPPGSIAMVVIPCSKDRKVMDAGRIVKVDKYDNGKAYIKIGSGNYKFTAK